MKKRTFMLPLIGLFILAILSIFILLVSNSYATEGSNTEESYTYLPMVIDLTDLLLRDDFSDPESGWPVDDDVEVKWSYQDGEYEMLIRDTQIWAGALAPVDGLTNYNIRASMYRLQGTGNYVGLVFDWKDWDNFYYLVMVPGEQWFGVAKVVDGTRSIVIGRTDSAFILPGNATNRLRIDRDGTEIAVSINGKRLATAQDRQFPGPYRAGLYMESDDDAPAINRYDDVEIWRADNALQQKAELSSFDAPFASGGGFDKALNWEAEN